MQRIRQPGIQKPDKGNNWTSLNLSPTPLHKIIFHNNHGYCTGLGTKLLVSENDGNTWKDELAFEASNSTDISFKEGIGFCIVDNINLYRTTDNGNTWINTNPFGLMGFTVVDPLTSNNCLVFGNGDYSGGDFGYSYGAVWQTTDSGNNWTSVQFKNIASVNCTSFYASSNGYAVAGNKLIGITVK
ncbi:MAG TPA: YCF48-related protein [Parafilimonas sp.]|nr:YCF48-related protein [Parafilimonas sp.]